MDTPGHKTVACHGQGKMVSRHNRLRDKIISFSIDVNLSPVCEQRNLIPEAISRHGDVQLPFWPAWPPAALYLTITSSLQPSCIWNAARKAGVALRAAEDRKNGQNSQQYSNIGVQFIPMAFESFGDSQIWWQRPCSE